MLTRLLKQSIITMCKEAVQYEKGLEIDALICISIDNERQQIVIKIHELFQKHPKTKSILSSILSTPNQVDIDQEGKKPKINLTQPDEGETATGSANNNAPLVVGNFSSDGSDNSAGRDNMNESVSSATVLKHGHVSQNENVNCAGSDGDIYTEMVDNDIQLVHNSYEMNQLVKNTDNKVINDAKNAGQHVAEKSLSDGKLDNVKSTNTKLQPSSLQNIHCKNCDQVLENGTTYEQHNANIHALYTCFVCLNTFTSRNNMNRHIRLHSGAKPYTCPKCPERFTRKDDVKRHLLRHEFDKPYRCAICCKGYSDKIGMRGHIEREHGSKQCYSCPRCGKCYCDFDVFQLHKKSHTEFQQYSCSLCNFTGSNALMYSKHMLSHKTNKKYACAHCDLGVDYKDPFLYTTHLKTHRSDPLVKSFKCCFCDVSLATYELFVRHEHSHVQRKTHHVCYVCNETFECRDKFHEHILTHEHNKGISHPLELSEIENHDQEDNEKVLEDDAIQKGAHPIALREDKTLHPIELREDKTPHPIAIREDKTPHPIALREDKTPHPIALREDKTPQSFALSECNRIDECLDYWCAECSKGFATERILENHILEIHEQDESVIEETVNGNYSAAENPQISERRQDQVIAQTNISNELADNFKKRMPHYKSEMVKQSDLPKELKNDRKRYMLIVPYNSEVSAGNSSTNINTDHNMDTCKRLDVNSNQAEKLPSLPEFRKEGEDDDGPRSKLPKLFHLMAEPPPSSTTKAAMTATERYGIKTEQTSGDRSDVNQNIVFGGHLNLNVIKTEKDDRVNCNNNGVQDSRMPAVYEPKTSTYSDSSVHSISSESSAAARDNPRVQVLPNASLKMKVRPPGFEKVVTPSVLFRTKAPFNCEDCNEVFDDFSSFDQHGICVHHSFICEYCGKVFTAKPNRERHVRYHTGEKPYQCELCEESFFRGDDLKYHRTAKHGDVRPYACTGCKRTFIWNKDLLKHLKYNPHHTSDTLIIHD